MHALRPHAGLFGAFALTLVVCLALTAGIWMDPAGRHLLTPFGDSHAWVLEQLAQGRTSGRHCVAGYPEARELRLIGWVPLLAGLPLRAVLGPLLSFHLLLVLSLPLSGAAVAALIRRWTDAGPALQALLGASYALCPTLLATLAGGELPKLQAWILPVGLLAFDRALAPGSGPVRRLVDFVMVGLIGVGSAFTSPYYALALPFLAGGVVLGRLWTDRTVRTGVLGVVLLGLLAGAMSPASPYYDAVQAGSGQSIFQPARRAALEVGPLPHPAPVAEPYSLLVGPRQLPGSAYEPLHVPTLGLLLTLVGLAGLRGRGRGRVQGAALLTGGVVLALGPALVLGGSVVASGSGVLALPVYLLEALGYPTRSGGLYYRYAIVAVLGLCLLAARGLGRMRRGPAVGAALLLVHLAQGLWTTGPRAGEVFHGETTFFWPRPSEVVAGADVLASLRGEDGAVLDLPLQGPTDGQLGQGALLRALFHGRPTTGLPRDRMGGADPARASLSKAVRERDPGPLREAGYRLIVLDRSLDWYSEPDNAELIEALGRATHDGGEAGLSIWDLGPTEAHCLGEDL